MVLMGSFISMHVKQMSLSKFHFYVISLSQTEKNLQTKHDIRLLIVMKGGFSSSRTLAHVVSGLDDGTVTPPKNYAT